MPKKFNRVHSLRKGFRWNRRHTRCRQIFQLRCETHEAMMNSDTIGHISELWFSCSIF